MNHIIIRTNKKPIVANLCQLNKLSNKIKLKYIFNISSIKIIINSKMFIFYLSKRKLKKYYKIIKNNIIINLYLILILVFLYF